MTKEKFKIIKKNIYNFNKKKFIIDINIILLLVMTYKKLNSYIIIKIS